MGELISSSEVAKLKLKELVQNDLEASSTVLVVQQIFDAFSGYYKLDENLCTKSTRHSLCITIGHALHVRFPHKGQTPKKYLCRFKITSRYYPHVTKLRTPRPYNTKNRTKTNTQKSKPSQPKISTSAARDKHQRKPPEKVRQAATVNWFGTNVDITNNHLMFSTNKGF
mmetsp:Transcript_19875/g.22116  ORF Transcript_19875/g.22116 Transcript_19875/m.22116 type:complete len:169 (-) Transcript_19875:145-651(-)